MPAMGSISLGFANIREAEGRGEDRRRTLARGRPGVNHTPPLRGQGGRWGKITKANRRLSRRLEYNRLTACCLFSDSAREASGNGGDPSEVERALRPRFGWRETSTSTRAPAACPPKPDILGTGVYLVDVERGMCEGGECECRGFWRSK